MVIVSSGVVGGEMLWRLGLLVIFVLVELLLDGRLSTRFDESAVLVRGGVALVLRQEVVEV